MGVARTEEQRIDPGGRRTPPLPGGVPQRRGGAQYQTRVVVARSSFDGCRVDPCSAMKMMIDPAASSANG